ncbi:MAG: hypothetical protein JRF02_02665 [Deltaproteobacteria bacterium]|nr:hypothetical protein [Deltaproteobacteria bacterium]
MKKGSLQYILAWLQKFEETSGREDAVVTTPGQEIIGEIRMLNKSLVITAALLLFFLTGLVGCGKQHVRHLASDVSMLTPGTTTKKEVLNYLGQPDVEYKTKEGGILWVYYQARRDLLRSTPYIGDKLSEETYEIVNVTFSGDNVLNVAYTTMKEEEFKESGLAE